MLHKRECCGAQATRQSSTSWAMFLWTSHAIAWVLQHKKASHCLTLWWKFKINKPFDVKECNQHCFHIWFNVSCRLWSRRWCTFSVTPLLHSLWVIPLTPRFATCDDFRYKSLISSQIIIHYTAHIQAAGSLIAQEEQISQILISCEVLLSESVEIKLQGIPVTTSNS